MSHVVMVYYSVYFHILVSSSILASWRLTLCNQKNLIGQCPNYSFPELLNPKPFPIVAAPHFTKQVKQLCSKKIKMVCTFKKNLIQIICSQGMQQMAKTHKLAKLLVKTSQHAILSMLLFKPPVKYTSYLIICTLCPLYWRTLFGCGPTLK